MGKMNELSMILDDMIEAGNNMVKAAGALREYLSSAPTKAPAEETETEKAPAPAEEKKPLTKEDVRKLLVAKSNVDGGSYKPQVKALVRKYSETGNLSAVKPEQYEDLVAELEVIDNA